jgi:galactonate dehydratase
MKITKIDVYRLDGGVLRANRKPVVCRIHTDEGIYGDGEAGIALGVGSTGAFGMVKDLSEMVVGRDPLNIDAIWNDHYKKSFWGLGLGPIFCAGMSAINIALMDIKGKALGVPCYQLLGGKYRSEMRSYASQLHLGWNDRIGPWGSTQDYVRIVEYVLSLGYDAVKIDFSMFDRNGGKIPPEHCEGILPQSFLALIEERIRALRESCGYGVDIIVENHARTSLPGALQIGALCDKYKIMALEEPMGLMNPDMYTEISKKIKTPIAAGERIYTRWGYHNFFKNNSIQLIQPDLCNCGGITEAKKICDMAEVFDVTVQAHVAGTPISTAAALHLEAAVPNFCIHEHHFRSTQEAMTRLCKYDYQPENGMFSVPELPGIGQELSDWAIKNSLMHVTVDCSDAVSDSSQQNPPSLGFANEPT